MEVMFPRGGARPYAPPPAPPAPSPKAVNRPVVFPKELIPYQVPENLATAGQSPKQAPSSDQIKPVLEHLNKVLQELGYGVKYGLYDGTEEFYAVLTDLRTQRVVRHIPSEEILELHRRLTEMVGAFVDERI